MRRELIHKIFRTDPGNMGKLALEIFQYQFQNNSLYRRFCESLDRNPDAVNQISDIPFLPIRFFKSHSVKTGAFEPETCFESSGTTGSVNSKHYLRSLELYYESFLRAFELFYGDPADWCIIGLLPAYLERKHSSLIVMVNELIKRAGHPLGGFYLYDHDRLQQTLHQTEDNGKKTLLIGVSFALLDFAERYPMPLPHTTILETGGMKGRRKEITRAEMQAIFKDAFPGVQIHSEYGMTELLSQAYASDDAVFHCPPWMKVLLRAEDDPLSILHPSGVYPTGKHLTGVINVIDLANIDSCCFIATDDMGKLHPNGGFEVLGRLDNSDIRGCSQLVI